MTTGSRVALETGKEYSLYHMLRSFQNQVKNQVLNLKEPKIMYNVGGFLISCAPVVHVTPLETPFGLVISVFTISITRHYNCSQLSITWLRVYTIIIVIRS
jgi:hypothetical protein